MAHIGNLQKIQLSQILQEIETREKTGLLTISRDEQNAALHFLRGELTCVTKQGVMDAMQFGPWARQEAIEFVQNLFTWPMGEVYFHEGVQPPSNRFPLALRITSLIPPLINAHSTPNFPTSAPGLPIEEVPALISAPSPQLKTSHSIIEKASIPRTPHPFLFNESGPDTHNTPLAETPTIPAPIIKEPFGTAIHLLQTIKSSVAPARSAATILPLPDYDLTTKLLTPRKSNNAIQRWEVLLIALLLLIVVIVQGINMFYFPYYEQDEGTYMSQAWAVVHMGRLAYYTYFYDHSPLGWIQIAGWTIGTAGFH